MFAICNIWDYGWSSTSIVYIGDIWFLVSYHMFVSVVLLWIGQGGSDTLTLGMNVAGPTCIKPLP